MMCFPFHIMFLCELCWYWVSFLYTVFFCLAFFTIYNLWSENRKNSLPSPPFRAFDFTSDSKTFSLLNVFDFPDYWLEMLVIRNYCYYCWSVAHEDTCFDMNGVFLISQNFNKYLYRGTSVSFLTYKRWWDYKLIPTVGWALNSSY